MRLVAIALLTFLVIWGAVHPMSYFIAWFETHGYALGPLVDAWYVNDASAGLVWDLTIAAIALTVWALYAAVTQRWYFITIIAATFMIGVSCGLPLMLLMQVLNRPKTL